MFALLLVLLPLASACYVDIPTNTARRGFNETHELSKWTHCSDAKCPKSYSRECKGTTGKALRQCIRAHQWNCLCIIGRYAPQRWAFGKEAEKCIQKNCDRSPSPTPRISNWELGYNMCLCDCLSKPDTKKGIRWLKEKPPAAKGPNDV